MTTAFVLSGGGSLGAVQVGMLRALGQRGIGPDLLVGTSAGALNALFIASHGTSTAALDRLDAAWAAMRRDDVFPLRAPQMVLAVAGARAALCSASGLEHLVRRLVPLPRLEDAQIPVHLVATDLLSGEEVLLSRGDAMTAVLASSAVPAVLPPVRWHGRTLVDGALADNAAISQAIRLGADRVVVLPTGYACALATAPSRPLAVALQALSLLVQQRLITDIERYGELVDVVVLPPLCPLGVSAVNFRHAVTLSRRAYAAATAWLDSGEAFRARPARVLGLHGHRRTSSRPDADGPDQPASTGPSG
jgi:NTE family protein